jgi:hypothetical protein
MGKIIFWLLLVFAALLVWRITSSKSRVVFRKKNDAQNDAKSAASPAELETMHACEMCGAMSPRSACVEQEGHLFCGVEHRKAWAAQHAER